MGSNQRENICCTFEEQLSRQRWRRAASRVVCGSLRLWPPPSSLVTFWKQVMLFYAAYCLRQRWRCCLKPPVNTVQTGSGSIPCHFCGLVCNKPIHHCCLPSWLSSHSGFFSLKIYKHENSDGAQHEIMFPPSSLSSSTYELWRLEFQRRSVQAADRRVKLSGSRAGNARRLLKPSGFPFGRFSTKQEKQERLQSCLMSAGPASRYPLVT